MSKAWFSHIESYFVKEGSKSSSSEQTLFVKRKEGKFLIVCIYVDDLLFISDDKDLFNEFKCSMKNEFDMTDLGKMRYFLGIEVAHRGDGIFICQKKYDAEVIDIFGLQDYNSACNRIVPGQKVGRDETGVKIDPTVYKQIVGSLMYLTATCPDLMFVGEISNVIAYTDSDYVGDINDSKSILGYVFLISEGGVAWSLRKQPIITLLTTKVEYVVAATCAC
ncbi:uncharacterized mitochondrial protein AtMg00810-like [Lathyrus oleraceus]|uniref:uncharacterized mitochondrial protein AtMg00810-like n=1 Tax=Pisum sativum TaxID=3888 RepID=UPI0021CFA8BD|nr:uncharacterized mitochondrial protein AtMg00810-like [Pisum sativum]